MRGGIFNFHNRKKSHLGKRKINTERDSNIDRGAAPPAARANNAGDKGERRPLEREKMPKGMRDERGRLDRSPSACARGRRARKDGELEDARLPILLP